ncbi:MAG: hypothetical protein MJY67_05595 [Bacteroidales bacterium]|nr:hypothetical protein [Bacteroidales bacterium]
MKRCFIAFMLIAAMFVSASCHKDPKPSDTPEDTPTEKVSLVKTSWIYLVPDDPDGGKMLISFTDETNFFLVNGDAEDGWWWPTQEELEDVTGKYTFDPETLKGTTSVGYDLELGEDGKLTIIAGEESYVCDKTVFTELVIAK